MRTATPKGQPTPIPGTPKFEPFTVPTHSTGPYAYDAQRHPTRCSEFVCLNESSCGNCASPNCNNNGVCKPGKHHCSWRPFRQRPNTARRVAKIKIKLLLAQLDVLNSLKSLKGDSSAEGGHQRSKRLRTLISPNFSVLKPIAPGRQQPEKQFVQRRIFQMMLSSGSW